MWFLPFFTPTLSLPRAPSVCPSFCSRLSSLAKKKYSPNNFLSPFFAAYHGSEFITKWIRKVRTFALTNRVSIIGLFKKIVRPTIFLFSLLFFHPPPFFSLVNFVPTTRFDFSSHIFYFLPPPALFSPALSVSLCLFLESSNCDVPK